MNEAVTALSARSLILRSISCRDWKLSSSSRFACSLEQNILNSKRLFTVYKTNSIYQFWTNDFFQQTFEKAFVFFKLQERIYWTKAVIEKNNLIEQQFNKTNDFTEQLIIEKTNKIDGKWNKIKKKLGCSKTINEQNKKVECAHL